MLLGWPQDSYPDDGRFAVEVGEVKSECHPLGKCGMRYERPASYFGIVASPTWYRSPEKATNMASAFSMGTSLLICP